MKICFSFQLLILLTTTLTSSCHYIEYDRSEREVGRTVKKITERDIFNDKWLNHSYPLHPEIEINQYPSRFLPGDFPVNLEIPIKFEVERNDHRIISGTFKNIKISILNHQLQSEWGNMPSIDPSISELNLSDIYGMTLDIVHSVSSDERERKFTKYAFKSILLPDEAKDYSTKGENEHIEAFVFGKIDKGRVLADVRLKKADKGNDLITVLFRAENDMEKNMSLIYEFLGGIKLKH